VNILEKIVALRRNRISSEGHAQGLRLPGRRSLPLVPFGREPFLICEIKRSSPSKGGIMPNADPVETARRYVQEGVMTVSVLTEQDHFGGSLADLRAIKKAFPGLCVLRKDFILDKRDLEVSLLAGADAVLLIAGLHRPGELEELYQCAMDLGLAALVETHSPADLDKAARFGPAFTGINSRNLETFSVDPAHPLRLRNLVNWETSTVYESGIRASEDVRTALSAGFDGVLAGESVMRDPSLAERLAGAFRMEKRDFWGRLFKRKGDGPLMKICGITSKNDAEAAAALGTDLLGFVFAPSPRRADPALLQELRGLDVLKVGVVTGNGIGRGFTKDLLDRGLIDAVQVHGDQKPEQCPAFGYPWYKALRLRGPESIGTMSAFLCPRVLVDAYVSGTPGGTGRRIDPALLRAAARERPLWVAGGITPANAPGIVGELHPELIDVSSGLESSPGKKDHDKLKRLFAAMEECNATA
jgi:indole-3-glycerol phosphate synthase/phosphoribosylanthranilate isomerase